jgi:predicted ferric reductase
MQAGRGETVKRTLKRPLLILLYAAVVCGPAIVASSTPGGGVLSKFSMTRAADLSALLAIAVLSMQSFLSARIRWIERPFGLDRVMLFHRTMAISAVALLLMHPLLLAADPHGEYGWRLLYRFSLGGEGLAISMGKAALTVLVTTAVMSLFRLSLKVRYTLWLKLHKIFALSIIAAGFVHSLSIGPHVKGSAMQTLWVAYPALALGALVYDRFIRAYILKAHAYRVADVSHETDSVWTLTMTAPGNGPVYNYRPGQFHFLTLYRSAETRHEQHPFTIASSPANRSTICCSIKASGDYTATIGKTIVGDRAALLGPFGRFSCLLHPTENNLVFIAGGIGITPFMSMLRHMAATAALCDVVLFYGNRTEKDIAFSKELEEIAAKQAPRLRVIHVLSRADSDWRGERGHITVELIERQCEKLPGRVFYLCGPPAMMMGLAKNLKKAGVKPRNIRRESFAI